MKVKKCIKLCKPEFFDDPEFVAWLDSHDTGELAFFGTHKDYSDVFMTKDLDDGSNSDMPKRFWDEIMMDTGNYPHCIVWIANEYEHIYS